MLRLFPPVPSLEKERMELERLRNMTEEERRGELRNNPKQITNKAAKGKYKFLQKYYHRGAFFMDKEEGVYRRDFSGSTLEDRFDKTVLPKVMQVSYIANWSLAVCVVRFGALSARKDVPNWLDTC